MTSPDQDWIQPGVKVAEFNHRGFEPNIIAITTIERLTPTQIVLTNGNRYNRAKLTRVGDDPYRSPKLVSTDDQSVRDAQARRALRKVTNTAHDLGRVVRGGEDAVLVALDEIEQAVRAARQAITGKEN